MDRKHRTRLVTPLIAAVLGFGAFVRIPGSENVRAVQIVALLAAGMGLGVTLAHFMALLRAKAD